MGLAQGCYSNADTCFAQKWKLTTCTKDGNSMLLRGDWYSAVIQLTNIPGDCTACTLYSEFLKPEEVEKIFQMIQEYMSMNARISCFFSKKIYKNQINTWLKELQKFPIAGLHLQKSNREPGSDMYMLSGILKVPNPLINSYTAHNGVYPDTHNHNDVTKLNDINKQFNLPTF